MRRWTGPFRNAAAGTVRGIARVPAGMVVAARAVSRAMRRPGTRLGLHGLVLLGVLGAAIYTGLYVVPSGAHTRPAAAPSSAAPGDQRLGMQAPEAPATDAPVAPVASGAPSQPPGQLERPQDALAAWADGLRHLGIPKVALQAYGYAELTLAQTQPGCNLSWPTLAGIGRIESNHGRSHGAEVLSDGRSNPPVIGLPLDGGPNRMEIRDTDAGKLDGDHKFDRAVGAMQFIPTTWLRWATDGDGDGRSDPFDIDDAALAAARYLCAGDRDLATGQGWWDAIMSYNHMESYVRSVFSAADQYGRLSRGGR